MATEGAQGGCQCGRIRYRIDSPAEGSMLCHCRTCRKVSGAPVLGWISTPSKGYRVVQGEPVEFSTSPPVRRTFCGDCGTPLTYSNADEPESIDVTTCSLDDAHAYPPTHHSWLSHDLPWVKFGDGLPQFPKSRYGAEESVRAAPQLEAGAIRRLRPETEYFTSELCHIVEVSNSPDDPGLSIARARVQPGMTTRWHRVIGTTERYVILEGSGRVEVGNLPPTQVGPGDVVIIPPGVPQRIANEGTTQLVFLAICTPRFVQTAYQDIDDSRGRS